MALDLKDRAPKFITNIPLWEEFLDAITTELNIHKTEISKKPNYLNIDTYTDIDELKSTANAFGYSPILNIAGDDLDYLKQEFYLLIL